LSEFLSGLTIGRRGKYEDFKGKKATGSRTLKGVTLKVKLCCREIKGEQEHAGKVHVVDQTQKKQPRNGIGETGSPKRERRGEKAERKCVIG